MSFTVTFPLDNPDLGTDGEGGGQSLVRLHNETQTFGYRRGSTHHINGWGWGGRVEGVRSHTSDTTEEMWEWSGSKQQTGILNLLLNIRPEALYHTNQSTPKQIINKQKRFGRFCCRFYRGVGGGGDLLDETGTRIPVSAINVNKVKHDGKILLSKHCSSNIKLG